MKIISLSAVLGLFISLALFWLMQMMISNNQQGFKKTENIQMTEFVRLKRETKLQTKERKIPDEPPPPEKRPPPPQLHMQQTHVTQNNAPQMDMPRLDIPLQTSAFSGSLMNGTEIDQKGLSQSPIEVYKPKGFTTKKISPADCTANRGVWVNFSYILTKNGNKRDFILIEGRPRRKARRYFKIAKKNERKIKLTPALKNGKPIDKLVTREICIK